MIKHSCTAVAVSGCILILPYLGLVSSAGSPSPREKATKEYFHAVVAGEGNGADLTIVIEGYTTREDAQLLVEASRSGDREALQKALSKMNKGRFRFGMGWGNPLRIVQSVPTEKGRKITVVADRDRQWFEPPGSRVPIADYPYTFAELDLDENGKGTGVLMPFARVRFADNGLLKIENYSVAPWRLVSVTSK
jgi:hypothetical protein